ncbi:hypothetical protein J2Y48_004041 [Mycoplana sp. BE70]|nr:hypothetical protein [Mycoplana sp. BE70]
MTLTRKPAAPRPMIPANVTTTEAPENRTAARRLRRRGATFSTATVI